MTRRYSKSGLIILGIIMLCFAVGFGISAFQVFARTDGWFRYVAVALLAIVSVLTLIYGLIMLIVSAGMNYGFQTQKDSNPVIHNTNVNICRECGTHVGKKAEYCHKCGAKIINEDTFKICPSCKARNKYAANFCEKCGSKMDNNEKE